jgi:hypothetical protein
MTVSESPQAAAEAWVKRVLVDGDLLGVWPRTDPTFRLCLTQAWVWANRSKHELADRDHEGLAVALAESTPNDSLWPAFVNVQLNELRSLLAFDPDVWGISERSRPVSPVYEWVFFAPETIQPEAVATVMVVLLHRTAESWLVANLGDTAPPEPSWPPQPRPWKPVIDLD